MNGRLGAFLFCAVWFLAPRAASARPAIAHFTRACPVFLEPDAASRELCRQRAGAPITFSKAVGNSWIQIETPVCAGFVPDACVSGPESVPRETPAAAPHERVQSFKIGLGASLDGLLGTVAGVSGLSQGDGWSVSLRIEKAIFSRLHIVFVPGFQVLGLSRTIDMSGPLTDPSPTSFSERIQYLSAALLASWAIQPGFYSDEPALSPEIWLEAGVQYLSPVSATVSTSAGSSTPIQSTDRPLLLLLGPAVDLAFSPHFSALLALHLFYNLKSTGGNSFFGARLAATMTFGLF